MLDILQGLEPEKRDRIINSAFEEFSKNRFAQASTNNIVRRAGISKGLLFHYFPTKEILYDYLILLSIETVAGSLAASDIWAESDLFRRLKLISITKYQAFQQFPFLMKFAQMIYDHRSLQEVKDLVKQYAPDVFEQYFGRNQADVYSRNVDLSLFKEGVDLQRVIRIVEWTLAGMAQEWLVRAGQQTDNADSLERLMAEVDAYLELFRSVFYR